MGRKRVPIKFRERSIINHPMLYLYQQILKSIPKIFNVTQKDYFTQQKKTLFKRNTKDKVFEGRWIMK